MSAALVQDGKRQKTGGAKKVQTSKKPRLSAAHSGSRQLSLSSFFNTVKQESWSGVVCKHPTWSFCHGVTSDGIRNRMTSTSFKHYIFFFYFYTNLCILYTVRVSSDTPVGIRLWDISSLIWCIVDYVFYHHVIMMTSLAMKLHWWHPKKKVISSQVKSHFTCILWDNCHVYYHNKTAVFVQTKWRDCTLWIVKAQTQDKQTGFMQADGTCPLSNKMYSVIMCHGESD